MVNDPVVPRSPLSRRGFLHLAAGAAATAPFLASCSSKGSSGGSGSSSKTMKFWDMPWGGATYNPAAKKVAEGYKPASGLPGVTYQEIQWANFVQTFSSAVASKTNPAVSTGGGFQAFQFAQQGAIAYADDVIADFKKDGTYDDFLPGVLDPMKVADGYVAVPWNLDLRAWWYRKSLLDQAGTTVPTTWEEMMTAGVALKKIGVYGFASGSGAGNNLGSQGLLAMMINNGGGLFDADGKLDVLAAANVEAMTFVQQLAGEGIVDPASVSYTGDNQNAQWKNKKFGMGIDTQGLDGNIGDTSGDLLVMSPLTSPSGSKAGLGFENNIMMYKNTPSQKGSEAFLKYYVKNMHALWDQNVVGSLPVLKSIVSSDAFQKQTNKVKVIAEYQPVFKSTQAAGKTVGLPQAKIDGNNALFQFAQSVLTGKTAPKDSLTSLSNALAALLK